MSEEMTAERAAEILDPDRKERFNSFATVEEACRMGRDVLRKQIPVKTVIRGRSCYCPVCDSFVFHCDNYCSECGQAIVTEDDDEG